MRTCKEVARLISEGLDRELPLLDRIGVRFHLFICRHCRCFRDQLHVLHQAIRLYVGDEGAFQEGPSLCMEAKERMKRALAKKRA